MIDRRDFFIRTLGAVLAARLAPVLPADLPEPTFYRGLSLSQLNDATLKYILPAVRENFLRESPLLAYLKDK